MTELKIFILSMFGIIGGAISTAFGGWTSAMTTLAIFMIIDYITGFVVAGIFNKSPKTDNGGLNSKAGFKGLCKKGMILFMVLIACRLDIALGTKFIRDVVIIGYIANETISIVENAGLMGLPIPNAIIKAIDVLQSKAEKD